MALILGHNINTSHGFITVAKYARETESDVCQIFLRPPQNLKQSSHTKEEIIELSNELKKYNVQVLIHSSFLINMCQPLGSDKSETGINILVDDLNKSVLLNAIGVVVHMGRNTSKLPYKGALNNYIESIKKVLRLSDKKSTLLLETGAGCGSEVGTDLYTLGTIREKLTESEKKRVKFCLDTCHMYAAGYDIGSSDYVKMLEHNIEYTLGWSNVAAIHLNDSKFELNCRKDRHADLGCGYIGMDGIVEFVKLCTMHKVPIILETPVDTTLRNGDKNTHLQQIRLVRQLTAARKS